MNVVVYGATGKAGSRIVKELLSRGHNVTAVVRDSSKLEHADGLFVKQDDLSEVNKIADVIKGTDAVVSAYAPPPDNTDALVDITKRLMEAVKKAGVDRLLVVGGAGTLEVAPGVSLINSGHLPEAWRPIAISHAKALDVLKASDIDWTYLSPAAYFEPGERTGKFRLGKDELISDGDNQSRISMEDYAIAMVDELENPSHRRERFSVGY
jgi:putative NADH-flavin reductase